MKKYFLIFLLIFLLFQLFACHKPVEPEQQVIVPENQSSKEVPEKYRKYIKSIEPFFKPMGEPSPDEWLATFPENGQTFEQYINSDPTLPTEQRNKIYIQPIGKFDKKQKKVIEFAAEYMEKFYNLPVKLLDLKHFEEPLSLENYRIHSEWKIKQIRTGYILEKILLPELPADAAAMIAFTSDDLYPDKNFNFVFGQASLENRVGVWSLYRLDDNADFKTFLKRTLKVSVHETGHMFSITHCTKFQCVMSGTNHLGETDKRPIDACPECMAKIVWMTKSDPQKRYKDLAVLCDKFGLVDEADLFRQKAEAVSKE